MNDIGDFIGAIFASPFICCGWIIIGAVAGGLARQLLGAKNQSFISDLILGILGALVGGFIAGLFDVGKPGGGLGLVIVNLLIATGGAALLIFLRRTLTGSRR